MFFVVFEGFSGFYIGVFLCTVYVFLVLFDVSLGVLIGVFRGF